MSTATEVRARTAAVLATAQAAHDAALALPDDPPDPGTPVEPPPPAKRPRFAIYPGATPSEWAAKIAKFEQSTGIDVEQVGGNQDQRYEGARGSVAGCFGAKVPVPVICVAIQLAFTEGPYGDTQGRKPGAVKRKALAATISGENDEIYAANVKVMQASTYERIILRLGSEGDINWPPHSFVPGTETNVRGNDDLYREAWAYVGARFRAALGSRVRLAYTTTMFASANKIVCHDGKTRTALEAGYPGDDLADIVGIDCYLAKSFPMAKQYATGCYEFAQAHGKLAAFDEWGIGPDGHKLPADEQCAFIQWIASRPVEYASFFAGWATNRYPDAYTAASQKCLAAAWK